MLGIGFWRDTVDCDGIIIRTLDLGGSPVGSVQNGTFPLNLEEAVEDVY